MKKRVKEKSKDNEEYLAGLNKMVRRYRSGESLSPAEAGKRDASEASEKFKEILRETPLK
ncbi:hypothetical protein UZ36_04740 [Candidatus Nitromaritima sp. SCGC AAA799-C22]|nr:hypothetical protein UZ36_04740 [Candidatus Nitromaritima sp. SCGC AAA799-C22]